MRALCLSGQGSQCVAAGTNGQGLCSPATVMPPGQAELMSATSATSLFALDKAVAVLSSTVELRACQLIRHVCMHLVTHGGELAHRAGGDVEKPGAETISLPSGPRTQTQSYRARVCGLG